MVFLWGFFKALDLYFQVEQRDVPGIDNAFLAMDTEEGVEVVWNEVQFSENRNRKAQQVLTPEPFGCSILCGI